MPHKPQDIYFHIGHIQVNSEFKPDAFHHVSLQTDVTITQHIEHTCHHIQKPVLDKDVTSLSISMVYLVTV